MARPYDIANAFVSSNPDPRGIMETDPRIQEYLKNGGINMDPATQAWCAAFVNASLAQAGAPKSKSNLARGFLNYGDPALSPREGDIAVFARSGNNPADAGLGHAGFYAGTDPYGRINTLGGNQGDAANVVPIEPDRLLGFRRPPGTPEETLPDVLATSVSPSVNQAIDRTSLLAGGDGMAQRLTPDTGVGGTMTPTLAVAEDANKRWGKYERNLAQILSGAVRPSTHVRPLATQMAALRTRF